MSTGFCVDSTTPTPNARACFISSMIGCFVGGFAVGGRYPATSSMYSSARRSVVPLWRRIQVTSLPRTSDVTNWRSSSDRCAVVTIAHRPLPSGVYSNDWMSSGCPVPHAANAGDASRPLSFIASFVRSSDGKNCSSSNTPSLRIGGCWTIPTSAARSSEVPDDHECWTRLARRMCSRLDSGSASMPTSPSRPDTKPSISSPTISGSSVSGTCNEPTMLIGTPDCEPGV